MLHPKKVAVGLHNAAPHPSRHPQAANKGLQGQWVLLTGINSEY